MASSVRKPHVYLLYGRECLCVCVCEGICFCYAILQLLQFCVFLDVGIEDFCSLSWPHKFVRYESGQSILILVVLP